MTSREEVIKSIEKHDQDLLDFVRRYDGLNLYHMAFALGKLAETLAAAMTLEGNDGRKIIDVAINENRKSCDSNRVKN